MSISLDSISAVANNAAASAATDTTASALQSKLNSDDLSSATDEELLEVCKEFESYFMEQIYKEMEKTIPKSDEDEDSYASQLTDYFMDSAYQKVAEATTEQTGGVLAQQLYEQMKRNYNLD